MFALIPASFAATPPGTLISNTASADFEDALGNPVRISSNTVDTVTVFGRTPSRAEFARLSPLAQGAGELLGPTQCRLNGVFSALPAPTGPSGQPLDLTAPQAVQTTSLYNSNETALVRLDDGDQNLDPLQREQVEVIVSNAVSGDSETLSLTETEINSGLFTGYIPLADATVASGNCVLEGGADTTLSIRYQDPLDTTDVSQALALLEPLSVVFDSTTGAVVDGATITLIDASSGLPATVYGNDGVSLYPSTVISGATVTDASGLVYDVPSGGYRFPVVAAGSYRLRINAPTDYIAPSNRTPAELAALPGASFNIADASYGNPFVQLADGAAELVDIPLDPFDGGLFLGKTTRAISAAIGDFIRYEIRVQNSSERVPATGIVLRDDAAPGLRYVRESLRIDDVAVAEPGFSGDGSSFTLALPDMPAGASLTVTYVMEVTAGVRAERLINRALATADRGVASNEASVAVRLREDLFRSRSNVIGRVLEADCQADTFGESAGVSNVRVYLENGRFAVTDEGGRFHIEGIEPGRHVLQMDRLTIPDWLELAPCDSALRFGGKADSQWVDLQPGLTQRADFYLKRRAPETGSVAIELRNAPGRSAEAIDYTLIVRGQGKVALSDVSATVLLPKAAQLQSESARINGRRVSNLRATGNAVVFVLGERSGQWQEKITFSASVEPTFAGELGARAVANFNSPDARNQRTPVGEARMMREAATTEQADYVLSLNFDVLSAELSAADRATLDTLIEAWRGVGNIELVAVGHTDSDGIAARNRHIFADNYALSEARAGAAARYLAARLNIQASALSIIGRGPDQPVASNDSADGKSRNRRVELLMTGLRPGRQSVIEVTQAASGELKTGTIGAPPGPDDQLDALDRRIAAIQATGKREASAVMDVNALPVAAAIVEPAAGFQPAIPSLTVSVAHAPGTRVTLSLNGKPVSALNFEGSEENAGETLMLSRWRGVDLADGDNLLLATVVGADDTVREVLRRQVHYAGQPIRGELRDDQSRLVADGRRRPVIAVQLFDAEGQPAREASIGDFRIDAPYRSWYEVAQERENKLVELTQRAPFYRVGPDGIAFIELEPTTRAGEVTLRLRFENQREQELRVYLQPAPRDWILVGFAEGTLGYNTLKDNVVAATAAGNDDDFYQDGRVAFFAKGRVRGDTLLTLAYDTRNTDNPRDGFATEVDPDQYFSLYGDGTESRFEAASQRKLFVKLERRQFVSLFGDFDTGLSTTDLSRYERRFNGLQAQYFGKRFSVNAFAAETDQSFQRDDIPGDGTSGLYRLSGNDLLINSESVRIETRDRFNASRVIDSKKLVRFVDYDIDYFAGTLFFKRPVSSRDGNLNPLVIVVEYEARNAADDDVIAGGRGALKFADGRLELGATVIRENNAVDANTLLGADLSWQLSDETLLRAEYADTERDDLNGADSGYAYKLELEHRSGDLDARIFHELGDSGFGLGQQAANQLGVQSSGFDARWKIAERWFTQAAFGHQENRDNGAERWLAEAELRYEDQRHTAFVGLGWIEDDGADGLTRESLLARAGASRKLLGDKLTLRLSTEQSLNDQAESIDYPARTLLGVDWNVGSAVLFAEHEFAEGAEIDAQTSRVGVRAAPWQRAQFTTTLDNEVTEFGPRLFANLGFVQGWQLSERWTLDVGLDHSNTLIDDRGGVFDPERELASGSLRSDFVAGFLGALYQSELWSLNSRVEQRNADNEDRTTVLAGWFREPVAGHALSAGVQYLDSDRFASGTERRADLRVGWAYRVAERRWSFLNRLDVISEESSNASGSIESARYINNFNATRRLGPGSELALQYAAKYVITEFDGVSYSGYTDLVGVDYRRGFRPRWEYALRAAAMHSWQAEVIDYSVGAELGFNPRDNVWLSFGYNLSGFRDADFDAARYTAAGPYVNVTIKADQHTLREIAGRLRAR